MSDEKTWKMYWLGERVMRPEVLSNAILVISAVPSRSDSAPCELSSETTSAGSMSFSLSSIGPSSARRAREMKDFPVPLVANMRFWPFGESFPSSSMIGPMCLALMLRQGTSFAVVFI